MGQIFGQKMSIIDRYQSSNFSDWILQFPTWWLPVFSHATEICGKLISQSFQFI